MNVEISVKGEDLAARHLDDLGRRAKDAKPVLNRIADMMQADQAANFAGRGSMFGGWAPLKSETIARKRAKGQPVTPLVATGALQRGLQKGRGKGKVRRVTKTRITIGTSLFYARFHQAHGRKVVGIRTVRSKLAVRAIERYITEGRW